MNKYVPVRGLRLFPVNIQGTDTPHVESMASFLCAAAIAHRRTPIQFLASILDYAGFGAVGARHLAHGDGSTMNGYGLTQRRIASALMRAFGQGDYAQLSLGQIGGIFAPKGGRVVKTSRHWCSTCYREQRRADSRVYDLLMWQVAELQLCPLCSGPLCNTCWKCGVQQQTIPRSGRMDRCDRCGSWLGERDHEAESSGDHAHAYQLWLVGTVERLLSERATIGALASGYEPARFLTSVSESRQVSSEELAKQIQLPLDTLTQWLRRRNKPTFTSWLRACANLGVDIADTLLDPVLSAHQLQLPFEGAKVYRPTRSKPHRKYDKEAVQAAIRAQLRDGVPTVASIRELASRLGMPDSMLYFHDSAGVKRLSSLLRQKRWSAKSSRAKVILKSARRILGRMAKNGQPLLRRPFAEELVQRTNCSIYSAKDIFPVVMAEFLAPRPTSRETSASSLPLARPSGASAQ